jgi:hypothetical protein
VLADDTAVPTPLVIVTWPPVLTREYPAAALVTAVVTPATPVQVNVPAAIETNPAVEVPEALVMQLPPAGAVIAAEVQFVNVIARCAAAVAQLTVPVIVNVAEAWLTRIAAVVEPVTMFPVSASAVPTACEMHRPVDVFFTTALVPLVNVAAPVPDVTIPKPAAVQESNTVAHAPVRVNLPEETWKTPLVFVDVTVIPVAPVRDSVQLPATEMWAVVPEIAIVEIE